MSEAAKALAEVIKELETYMDRVNGVVRDHPGIIKDAVELGTLREAASYAAKKIRIVSDVYLSPGRRRRSG